ncbi:MAG: hypothetical protein CMM08_09905, partial [Rhodospirillaceae bacterium]|nr:hypothetical protein [Rhodospirillaceae bacterium]
MPGDDDETKDTGLAIHTIAADFDPAKIEQRPFLVSPLLLRGHVTAILAPGGVGKSVFSISLGISVALGQRLLGYDIRERTNVLLVNNEDDCSEIDRRVAGICEHWEIPFGDLDQRVFILAGYGSPLVLAEQRRDGTVEPTDAVDGLISEMRGRKVGLLVLDPFVSLHRVEENNNVAVEQVLSILRRIANETGAADLLVHHTRKGQGGNAESHAGDADAGRGASALVYGTRAAFTLARMSKETAKKSHIEWDLGNRLFRLDSAKSNYAVKDAEATWFEMRSHGLPNGDGVGVPVPFNFAEIEERLAEEREANTRQEREQRILEVAETVSRLMTGCKQRQPEIV